MAWVIGEFSPPRSKVMVIMVVAYSSSETSAVVDELRVLVG